MFKKSDDKSQCPTRVELTGSIAWCECGEHKSEKRQIELLRCQEIAALNKTINELAGLCILETKKRWFKRFEIHDSRIDYLGQNIINRWYHWAA